MVDLILDFYISYLLLLQILKLLFQDPFDLSLLVSERMDKLGDFVVSPYKLKNYKNKIAMKALRKKTAVELKKREKTRRTREKTRSKSEKTRIQRERTRIKRRRRLDRKCDGSRRQAKQKDAPFRLYPSVRNENELQKS